VTIHATTSLTFEQASPTLLADYLRGRWAIENGLHHVRDATFADDNSQVPTGTAPRHGEVAASQSDCSTRLVTPRACFKSGRVS
jgi:predicted transposase YbfD/YdcC